MTRVFFTDEDFTCRFGSRIYVYRNSHEEHSSAMVQVEQFGLIDFILKDHVVPVACGIALNCVLMQDNANSQTAAFIMYFGTTEFNPWIDLC